MEFIILILISIVILFLIKVVLKINIKKVEEIAMDKELNELSNKYPSNIEVCQQILKMIKNEKVKIEEDKGAKTTLYLAVTDKIFIADTKESYTRIQTMAHECLHSIQDKRILLFNFIFSNLYISYFILITILTMFKIIRNSMIYLNIFLILSLTYYMIRAFLENDAMIKAKYLAREYMKKAQISSKDEIEKITQGFEKLNSEGIKLVNYKLFSEILIKVIIFSSVALIF